MPNSRLLANSKSHETDKEEIRRTYKTMRYLNLPKYSIPTEIFTYVCTYVFT